jgi:predicted GH43/DUF377 family glycosyl hydrolase
MANSDFQLKRLGTLMEPQAGNPQEALGVLNPAAARGQDGELYIFPRMVADRNFSRIGIARVIFDKSGDPKDVERLGVVLEPETDYELRGDGTGGCEDPRISFFEPHRQYVMTYTAWSPNGPRVAMAVSKDLRNWRRLGLIVSTPHDGMDAAHVDDKDACIFPRAVENPSGHPSLALLHRPLFPGTRPEETAHRHPSAHAELHRESIWICYCATAMEEPEPHHLWRFTSHRRLASPVAAWEELKIGNGTPPVLTKFGWMVFYHGVCAESVPDKPRRLKYSAGVMVMDRDKPHSILYRSDKPVLRPELPEEEIGTVGNVVFPTGIDRRTDIGKPDRYDVYYGMADDRIGVATMDLPDSLPPYGREERV